MNKFFASVIFVSLLFPAQSFSREQAFRTGVDLAMPYSLLLSGKDATAKGNLNVGLDARYFTSEDLSFGGRIFFDVQDSKGPRAVGFAPGLQYHWMPKERWDPYFRLDLPIIFRGAANSLGANDKFDAGIGAGLGLAWNVGDGIGVNNLVFRYDFALNTTFGIGEASSLLSLDLFRIGLDYRF